MIRRVRESTVMMPLTAMLRLRSLRRFAVLVIAALALASAGHFWHHLVDDCENPHQGFPHPCAQCAGFHAGVIAEDIQAAPAPRLSDLAAVFIAEDLDRAAQQRVAGSPRAPPLA